MFISLSEHQTTVHRSLVSEGQLRLHLRRLRKNLAAPVSPSLTFSTLPLAPLIPGEPRLRSLGGSGFASTVASLLSPQLAPPRHSWAAYATRFVASFPYVYWSLLPHSAGGTY